MKLSWNSLSRPMAALNIPARPTSWKAPVKRFIDDGKTSSFGIKKHCWGNKKHC